MDPLLVGLVLALLVPPVTRGSYRRLVAGPWAWTGLLVSGVALRVVLATGVVPESRWDDLGFGLIVTSSVLLAGFGLRNLGRRGMWIVVLGFSLTTAAVLANRGMPVDVPPDWVDAGTYQPTVWHHAQSSDDTLLALTDIIIVRVPTDAAFSFGDLIMVTGLLDVVFHASRRSRRRRAPDRRPRTVATLPEPSSDVPDARSEVSPDADPDPELAPVRPRRRERVAVAPGRR